MTTTRVVWQKDCTCAARATTNQMRISTRFNPDTQSHFATVVFHPMPSCDECGKPWKLEPTSKP